MKTIFSPRKCYLINKMFAGDYLKNGNIGHEITNFYLDDEGRNYIYVTNDGKINQNKEVECVFLVEYRSKGCLEILGVAKELEPINDIDKYIENERKDHRNTLKYCGVDYRDIFKMNKWDKENKSKSTKIDNSPYITFRANKFLCPKESPLLIFGKDYESVAGEQKSHLLKDKVFGTQQSKLYVECKKHKKSFKLLTNLLEDDSLWEENSEKCPKKVNIKAENQDLSNLETYLHIMGKTDSELIFSNMLAHFLRGDPKMMAEFCKEVLFKDIPDAKKPIISGSVELKREYEHIDLYIKYESETSITAIAIENKIKSGINGIKSRRKNNKIKSQLSDYYDIIKNEIEKAHKKESYKKFFIFAPTYRKNELNTKNLVAFKRGEEYEVIYYDQIYNFFKNYKYQRYDEDYYKEFIKMLKLHSDDYPNDAYIEMRHRFVNAIEMKK